ncbi:hypothetical protein DV515_00013933 [Chloebia gouldiae]|uniref:Uncharacterized protein n=1 Tax=Chloebia gouldiae TaxID=44316 RepID=A0A3L8RZF6_CHLGU|nr:hypothetical protein DV515_00013933 [Chloebia gouldiae]
MWSLLSQHTGFSGQILVFHWWLLTWCWWGARPPWEARQNNCTQVPDSFPPSASPSSHSSLCDGSVQTEQKLLTLLHGASVCWSRQEKKGADLVQFTHNQPVEPREGPAANRFLSEMPEILLVPLPDQKPLLTPYLALPYLFTWLPNTFFAGCYGSSLLLPARNISNPHQH